MGRGRRRPYRTGSGGNVTNFSGGLFTVEGREILATNGLIDDEMIQLLKMQE